LGLTTVPVCDREDRSCSLPPVRIAPSCPARRRRRPDPRGRCRDRSLDAGQRLDGLDPQIIGGHPTPIGAYPFQAALIDLTRAGSDYDRQICGGTLIAPTWVLTAAHCVTEGGVTTTPVQLKIVLGRTSLTSHNGESHTVKAIYWSARYREDTDADDVALVQFTTPSACGPIGVASAVQDSFEVPGTMLTVIGWGDVAAQPALQDPPTCSTRSACGPCRCPSSPTGCARTPMPRSVTSS